FSIWNLNAATGISGFTSSPNPPIGRLSFDDDDSVTRRVAFPYRYLHRLTFNSYGMKNKNYSWVYKNSLSLALVILCLFSMVGQVYTGMQEYNDQRQEDAAAPVTLPMYLKSGPFRQSTFENWESEFLQMAAFIIDNFIAADWFQ